MSKCRTVSGDNVSSKRQKAGREVLALLERERETQQQQKDLKNPSFITFHCHAPRLYPQALAQKSTKQEARDPKQKPQASSAPSTLKLVGLGFRV